MGQYYEPAKLAANKKTVLAWLYSHDYGNGLKLMEHSWVGNRFVRTVEKLLSKGGDWYKSRIVWAGDYAENCKGRKSNVYDRCKKGNKIMPSIHTAGVGRYIVNHSKKLYVDKKAVPKCSKSWNKGLQIHPLPLLTCEGNGQGGGDYYGESKLIGIWARDIISIEYKLPTGYNELVFNVTE